jgi:hypothetical protein
VNHAKCKQIQARFFGAAGKADFSEKIQKFLIGTLFKKSVEIV